MEDVLEQLLFNENPSSQKRAEIQECLDQDPEMAKAWAHWQEARAHVRRRLNDRIADRRLLVLYVLDQKGMDEAMTPSEEEAISGVRDDIANALDELSALEDVVECIREECDDFDEAWSAHAGDEHTASHREDSEEHSPSRNASMRSDRAPRHRESRDGTRARRWVPRLTLAAVVIGIAVASLFYWPGSSETKITVADGSMRSVSLSDGSTVRLVGQAVLSYPETFQEDDARRVTLEKGRAFFDVTPRSDGPSFVVHTPTARASVLGTQFGVRASSDTTQVVLASGSVQIGTMDGGGDAGVVLEPGQQSWVVKGQSPSSPTEADLTSELEWTGLFVFRSMPMASVVERLSRQYDASIAVDDALADERVTGTFEREQPVQQVLDALATTFGAEVERTDNQYHIVPTE